MSAQSTSTSGIIRNEAAKPHVVAVMNRLANKLKPSLCQVIYNNCHGTGALIALPISISQTVKSFVTCHHVLGSNDPAEIYKMKLIFESESMKMVRLVPEWYSLVWNSSDQYYDVTVIEFNEQGTAALNKLGAEFLLVDKPFVGQRVVMFQYPDNDLLPNVELSFDANIIESITKCDEINKINYIIYHIGAEGGSSGSPILTYDCKVVGVHRRRVKSQPTSVASITHGINVESKPTLEQTLGFERHASDITQVITAFAAYRSRCKLLDLSR